MNESLSAALKYAANGFAVFPAKPGNKAPYIKGGLHNATTDADRIKAWWRQRPDAMIGCPCGANGFCAIDLDVDGKRSGLVAWHEELNISHEDKAIPGAIQRTPSGGYHYLFEAPGPKVVTRAGKLAPGIDVRGDGGYIILAPSKTMYGDYYEWLEEWQPGEPLPQAPAWLLDLICEQPKAPQQAATIMVSGGTPYGITALEGEVLKVDSAEVGTRNATLNTSAFRVGQLVGGGEIEQDTTIQELSVAAEDLSADDGHDATLKIITSGMQSGMENPRKAATVPMFLVDALDTDQLVIPAKEYYHTDAGNSELMRDLYRDYLRYDHRRNRWLLWQGHKWEQNCHYKIVRMALNAARLRLQLAANLDDSAERRTAAKFALASENRNRINSALDLVKNLDPIADVQSWDCNLYLLGCANGMVDLRTGQLRDGKPDDRVTLSTGIDYDPGADCSCWERFLSEIFDGDQDMAAFIQRAVGYSLTGDTREQCLFLCWGGGANGKSTMLNIVRSMLGDYSANTPFSTFEMLQHNTNTNDLAALADRRLVTASETSDSRQLNESRVKSATGSDPITARHLYRENFTYTPQFKIWLAMNHRPTIRGTDDGIWRRIRLIPYTVSFRDNADHNLENKLRDEVPGILAWAVRGCTDWQAQGLNPPLKVVHATDEYREESDHVNRFLGDATTIEEGGEVKASTLYNRYEWNCVRPADGG